MAQVIDESEYRDLSENMITFRQHYQTWVTAVKPLPLIVGKPALIKFWLLNPLRGRLILLAVLLAVLIAASPVSQAIVDAWHPLNQNSLTTGLQELLNSPMLRKLQNLRETRYWQLVVLFWLLGFSAAAIVLILDLPRSIEAGERRATELMGEADEVGDSNLQLAETLKLTASKLRIDEHPTKDQALQLSAGNESPSAAIAKTRAVPKVEIKVRYIGPNRRYRIERVLASGGAGVVYQAQDMVLGRQVALKELLEDLASDQEQAERFKAEAKALALLNHAHILPVYDLLEDSGRFWLVMELMTGGTLLDRIEQPGAMEVDQCIDVTRGIASGLGFAHQQGFVHRDIKPANILFASEGSYRITDFGIAKHQEAGIKTSHGLILGSPGYMSPEQAAGETVDTRSDIYSLGITLYQMLTTELPFQGDASSVMAQHITKPPCPPSTLNEAIPEEVDTVVLKMLAKKPDDRFATATDLIEALNRCKQPPAD
ncbi:MAG: serine/threonine protein kinase [Gammaproteobacteria bacterium]|nr:serine/threonine protein kinase [Gammaproteobacteria bacterium]